MAIAATNDRPPVYGSSGLMPRPFVDYSRGRTNNRLIRGPKIDVPATVGLETDPIQAINKAMDYKWTHDHNTASQGRVLIPKGHIVAFSDDGLIRFADADASDQTIYPAGLSYLNLFKPVADRLAANRPGLAVRGYFELPVFGSYADAIAAGHKWGAIIAHNDGAGAYSLKAGDMLRLCGSGAAGALANVQGALAPGWLTNSSSTAGAPLTPYAGEALAQILEFDQGPTFDGLTEWVQFDNPFEFEYGETEWLGGDADRYVIRDPNSPTGYTFNNYPYDPRLQDPWFREAAGLPNLSDGASWEVISEQKVIIPDGSAGAYTGDDKIIKLYYYAFGGIGALLKPGGGAWDDTTTDVFVDNLLTTTLDGATVPGNATALSVDSVSDDGIGTLTITISGGGNVADIGGELTLAVKSKGQVAGVPVNIDIQKCIGLARFQMNLR